MMSETIAVAADVQLVSIHFHCSLWFIFSTVKLSTDYVKEEVDLPGGNEKIPYEKITKIAIISHFILTCIPP